MSRLTRVSLFAKVYYFNAFQMADHSNQLPPEYDDIHPPHYDPSFTARVSTSMRVPDRIAVANDQDSGDAQILLDQYNIGRSAVDMNVPDKIVVAG